MRRYPLILLPAIALACVDATQPTGLAKTPEPRFFLGPSNQKTTPFDSYDFQCPYQPVGSPGTLSVTGNTLHVRDFVSWGYHASTVALVDGWAVARGSAQINLANGSGTFQGTVELTPATLNGTGSWFGSFGGHFPNGRFDPDLLRHVDIRIVAHGTGTLEGQSIVFDHFSDPTLPHVAGPPGCEFDGELFRGVILQP